MTRIDKLVAAVGEDRFARACEWAWATAAGTGRSSEDDTDTRWPRDVTDVPHELEDLVWDEGPWTERLELAFELYREMPCYATLMYTRHHFPDWDDDAMKRFWDEYRSLLSHDDDRLADPVSYSLWCNYFEDPDSVEAAWSALTSPGRLFERGMQRVLEVSGPVPYELKAPVYDRLVKDRSWHPFIFRSLLASAFDVFGKIDAKAARKVLARLSLARTTPGLVELTQELEALASPPRPPRKKKRERRDRRAPRRG